MRPVTLQQPKRVSVGDGCAVQAAEFVAWAGWRSVTVVTSPPVLPAAKSFLDAAARAGLTVTVHQAIDREPTVEMFHAALAAAR
jgi:alcohol dehydrogenase class IV